jgi:hypothetical protein
MGRLRLDASARPMRSAIRRTFHAADPFLRVARVRGAHPPREAAKSVRCTSAGHGSSLVGGSDLGRHWRPPYSANATGRPVSREAIARRPRVRLLLAARIAIAAVPEREPKEQRACGVRAPFQRGRRVALGDVNLAVSCDESRAGTRFGQALRLPSARNRGYSFQISGTTVPWRRRPSVAESDATQHCPRAYWRTLR